MDSQMTVSCQSIDFDDEPEEDALHRLGPKHGITISPSQIGDIFARHLQLNVKTIRYIQRGYNNLLFAICTDDGAEYILKVCGRYWQRTKTETEVVGLRLMQTFTSVPVPAVLAWNSDKAEVGVEYIIMEKMDGVPLDVVWLLLTTAQKREIVRQLADVIVQMKTSPLIRRFLWEKGNLIGNFQIDDPKDVLASCRIVRLHESGGPFATFKAYYIQNLSEKITALKADTEGILASHKSFLPRLERFLDFLNNSTDFILDTSSHEFVFFHGDFSMANVIVSSPNQSGDPVTVKGVLDWEWCGPHVAEEEFNDCDFLRAGENLGGEQVDKELEAAFFDFLEHSEVSTPRNLAYMQQRNSLNMVKDNVAPWYLTDILDKNGEEVKKSLIEAAANIDTGLKALGF